MIIARRTRPSGMVMIHAPKLPPQTRRRKRLCGAHSTFTAASQQQRLSHCPMFEPAEATLLARPQVSADIGPLHSVTYA